MRFNGKLLSAVRFNAPNVPNMTLCCNSYFFFLMWNRFLEEVKGSDIWMATGYTVPHIDKAGQALVAEDGFVVEG